MEPSETPGDPDPAQDQAADGGVAAKVDTTEPTDDARDDVKRRFREALDRKRGRSADAATGADGADHAKVHGTHGPAQHQRQFRRKSGG
jgi:Family of unknown function (DUF5302)